MDAAWRGASARATHPSASRTLALLIAIALVGAAFVASVAAFLASSRADAGAPRSGTGSAVGEPRAATSLNDAERALVLSYVGTHRPEDPLVQVRPGVQAKRSNVQGVAVGGRTVYYDILGHQSFGPLASGRVSESEIDVISREGEPPYAVLLYTLKR